MKTKKSTPKMSGLVVAALRNLRDAHGSTAKEIMKYIMAEYNASEATVQRQLKTALKRGVEYGILKKTNAGYSLNTDAEVIGPLDLAQMDACGKKKRRMSCPKPKRRCPPKCPRKRKRNPCPRPKRKCPKKRKRNPCNVCATRGRPCNQNVELVRDTSPAIDDGASGGGSSATGGRERTSTNQEPEKRGNAGHEDDDASATGQTSRSGSRSPNRAGKEQNQRSRSQSLGQSRYSGSDNEDGADDDL